MTFQKASRFFNTIRYLTLRQVVFRFYYRFARVRQREYDDVRSRTWSSGWSAPRWSELSTEDGIAFTFLGVEGDVRDPADWQAGQHSKLWLYNLHYLDDLNAKDIDTTPALAETLIRNWTQANPPISGDGWEPYPLSLRVVNLVKWFARNESLAGSRLESLATQADALSQQLEYHILGNHLFANGKALVFVGAYLSGAKADEWLAKGLQILDEEVAEQFLQDGGHFELSPMYHATLLWDMCDLVNLAQCSGLPELNQRLPRWQAVISRGLAWLRSLLHPDGKIGFFNDAAFGVAPDFMHIEEYAARLGISIAPDAPDPVAFLNSATGYAVVRPKTGVKALLDLAQVGPDYQPGHAHADTLSFELSVFGQRLVVNSGTSQYGEGAERQRQRSTGAHSTVEVAGQDSSEVWAGFRVARRARPTIERFDLQDGVSYIQASHNGYRRLSSSLIHRRTWTFSEDRLEMIDQITSDQFVAVARLYIHPDVSLSQGASRFVADMGTGKKVVIELAGADQVRVVASTWHPGFGCSIANQCIEATFSGRPLTTHIHWS
ncbi:heparinase II/III family protein [Pseudomonas ogarae]|uniref:Heparinase n=1 Tax=Pseudomonas ogarae (strain DSM 112162 / CECT 30235 / F113) TaxID=1114970 RepID=A0ABM6QY87_PSEO1|nr:heparinase II/III family protein [Pseudomonas ogarae]AEV61677.1 heparinase II III family protein [Pseudomonas ogarae]AUO45548.1 heparinase [Pseudomonas ogarae]